MRQPVRSYGFRTNTQKGAVSGGRDHALFAIDKTDLDRLAEDCYLTSQELADEYSRELTNIGELVRDEARRIAPSITKSSRIPKTIRLRRKNLQIRVIAGGAAAPHAGIMEYGSKRNPGTIRWPLFGDKNVWFSTPTRPFLRPAAQNVQPKVSKILDDIFRRALEKRSFF
jgi:HK97 gp10 family phage protein